MVGNPNIYYNGYFWPSSVKLLVQSKQLLDKFGLKKKVLCYIKDQGANLQTLTHALKSIVNCESLHNVVLCEDDACFNHVFIILCQYATNNDKVSTNCKSFHVFIKKAQIFIQPYVPKKNIEKMSSMYPSMHW